MGSVAGRDYIPRIVDGLLDEYLAGLPAVLLVGPRASGKTTTAVRRGRSVVRLDRPAQAGAFRADPDVALGAYDEPIVIDEWHLVPEVLGALKRTIDEDPRPGRFVLTGSAGADLSAAGWPATGRVVSVPFVGLTMREVVGDVAATPFLSMLLGGAVAKVAAPQSAPDLRGYAEAALTGGFPEVVLQSSPRLRRAWLSSYVDQVVSRDVGLVAPRRDPVRLRRYLQALAANTAGVVGHKTIYDAAGLDRITALAYDQLLETLFVTEQVPAWKAGRLGRLASMSKRYVLDAALLGPLLGLDARAVIRDADLLGRVIDTFVVSQLRAELAVCDEGPRLYHLREPHGRHEVDLVVEAADGRVAAIEVKASASPTPADAAHLTWLRDGLGSRFVAGVVLHTGPLAFALGDRLHAIPVCALWGSAG